MKFIASACILALGVSAIKIEYDDSSWDDDYIQPLWILAQVDGYAS